MKVFKRKIIQQGAGGSTISLPVSWIREQQLEPGEEVHITQIGNDLNVAPGEIKKRVAIELTLPYKKPVILHAIIDNYYRLGCEKLILYIKDEEQKKTLLEIVENMYTGFHVIEQDEKKLIIEQSDETVDKDERTILRKLFLFILDSYQQVRQAYEKKEKPDVAYMKNNIYEFRKIDNKFRRDAVKRKTITKDISGILWGISNYLLLVQHSIFHLVDETKDDDTNVSQHTIALFDTVMHHFEDMYKAFFKKSVENMHEIDKKVIDFLYKEVLPSLREYSGADAVIQYYIGEQARTIHTMATPLGAYLLCKTDLVEE